jgi:hypothetical protein
MHIPLLILTSGVQVQEQKFSITSDEHGLLTVPIKLSFTNLDYRTNNDSLTMYFLPKMQNQFGNYMQGTQILIGNREAETIKYQNYGKKKVRQK